MSSIRITIDGAEGTFAPGVTAAQAVQALHAQPQTVLCVQRGGVCMELGETLTEDCTLRALRYQDEEGRRAYERSLRFLFLLSMKRLYPGRKVRMLNSVGYGLYIRLTEGEMSAEMAEALERDMHALVEQDLPFLRETWTREEAIAYFEKEGWLDQAELMQYRSLDSITMYRIGE